MYLWEKLSVERFSQKLIIGLEHTYARIPGESKSFTKSDFAVCHYGQACIMLHRKPYYLVSCSFSFLLARKVSSPSLFLTVPFIRVVPPKARPSLY